MNLNLKLRFVLLLSFLLSAVLTISGQTVLSTLDYNKTSPAWMVSPQTVILSVYETDNTTLFSQWVGTYPAAISNGQTVFTPSVVTSTNAFIDFDGVLISGGRVTFTVDLQGSDKIIVGTVLDNLGAGSAPVMSSQWSTVLYINDAEAGAGIDSYATDHECYITTSTPAVDPFNPTVIPVSRQFIEVWKYSNDVITRHNRNTPENRDTITPLQYNNIITSYPQTVCAVDSLPCGFVDSKTMKCLTVTLDSTEFSGAVTGNSAYGFSIDSTSISIADSATFWNFFNAVENCLKSGNFPVVTVTNFGGGQLYSTTITGKAATPPYTDGFFWYTKFSSENPDIIFSNRMSNIATSCGNSGEVVQMVCKYIPCDDHGLWISGQWWNGTRLLNHDEIVLLEDCPIDSSNTGNISVLEGSNNGLLYKNIGGSTLAKLFYRLDEETLFFGKSNSLTWGNAKINAAVIVGTGNTGELLTNPFASTLIGYNVAGTSVNANSITSVGYQSLNFARNAYNICAFGTDAGYNLRDVTNVNVYGRHQFFTGNGSVLLDGANINAIGVDGFPIMTSATNLIAIGNNQGTNTTSALQSIIMGDEAARYKPSVTGTHVKGYQAAYVPSNPAGQVGLIAANIDGYRAMYNQHSFDYATARGYQAGFLNSYNSSYISTGTHLDGYQSGFNVYGANNTLIGYRTGARTTPTNITGAVALGYRAGDGWISNNELAIDNSNVTTPLIYGNFATNVAKVNGTFEVATVVNNNTNTNVLVRNSTTGALETNTAFGAGGIWQTDGTNVWRTAGNVGIGVGNPTFPLAIAGTFTTTASGNSLWLGNDATGGYIRTFGTNNFSIRNSSGSTTMTVDNATRNVGFNVAIPGAKVHIAAGTAAANTAPLKFTTGALLTTPEPGSVEFLTDNLYFTNSSATRSKLLTNNNNTSFTEAMDIYNNSLEIVEASTSQLAQSVAVSAVGEEFWWRKTGETGLTKMRKE